MVARGIELTGNVGLPIREPCGHSTGQMSCPGEDDHNAADTSPK